MNEEKNIESVRGSSSIPGISVKIYLPGEAEKKSGSLLAFASVKLGGIFAVNNIRVCNGTKGPFAAMPSRKGRDGEYHDICCPTTREMREALDRAVLDAYQKALEKKEEMAG